MVASRDSDDRFIAIVCVFSSSPGRFFTCVQLLKS